MTAYTATFFDDMTAAASRSADVIAPIVVRLLSPESVCDVGCGTGAWVRAFRQAGVDDVFGVDGPWVGLEQLVIDRNEFCHWNLTEPLSLARRFDLAISLEVAEHLPSQCSQVFVDSLVRHSDIVLFSAAIPYQGGTDHINEQWPEYWRDRFLTHGYYPVDCIRPLIWKLREVEWYYAQNALLFVASHVIERRADLAAARARTNDEMLSIVHPANYSQRNVWLDNPRNHGLRKSLRALPGMIQDALMTRLTRRTGSGNRT
jgi:SAM-dependent methyltransferase